MAASKTLVGTPGPLQLLLMLLLFLPWQLAQPMQLVLQGPPGRITLGSRASFKCSAEGLPSRPQVFLWLKDGERRWIPHMTMKASTRLPISYQVEINFQIQLKEEDIKSQLTCHLQLKVEAAPLQQSISFGDVLRVPPKIHLETHPPSPVQLNAKVMVICNVDSFYPDDVKVELFSMDAANRKGTVASRTSNPDGTFSLKVYLEVMATEDRNSSVLLCRIQQDSQPLVNTTTTLFITRNLEPESSQQNFILPLSIILFLSKIVIIVYVTCLFQGPFQLY